jgi:hypothetical protein
MQQLQKNNSLKPGNKTVQALKILDRANDLVDNILKEINADNAGYGEINELFSQIRADISDAKERSYKETIRIGILGGTGSGKSTLVNALMGDNLLPDSAIVFCTNIPITIKYSSQHSLNIESELEDYNYSESNVDPEKMKIKLRSLCKESENPNNNKKVTKITIGVPAGILDGKEIVDVPGFTKGNPLHQAFAERYAKHYCDVCLVLINNAGSVEINSHGGIDALAHTFQNRIDSTAFIINKCDEGSSGDIDFIERELRKYLKGEMLYLYRVSSKNSLIRSGDQYQFQDLLNYLAFLSSRKIFFLVKALLERLVANFASLRDLCHLNRSDLDGLHKDIKILMNTDFDNFLSQFNKSLCNDEILPTELPTIDISSFDLPSPIGIEPNKYREDLVRSLGLQSNELLNKYVQTHQAQFYRAFNSRFEERLGEFHKTLQNKVNEFENKFNVSSCIQMPIVENAFGFSNFNPSRIEKLKPPAFRLWAERVLPKILVRDVKFWLTPMSVKVGPFSIKLGLPIGVKRKSEMTFETQKNIPEEAIVLMNDYIYTSLDDFVTELNKAYMSAVTQFINDWRKCLRDYLKQIEIAKIVTEPGSLKKVDIFLKDIKSLSEDVAELMSQD